MGELIMNIQSYDFCFGDSYPADSEIFRFTHGNGTNLPRGEDDYSMRRPDSRRPSERMLGDRRVLWETSISFFDNAYLATTSLPENRMQLTIRGSRSAKATPTKRKISCSWESPRSQPLTHMHRALLLPEILAEVFRNLLRQVDKKVDYDHVPMLSPSESTNLRSDRRSLFRCLQVNRLWFEEATTCLWSQNPPIYAFLNVTEPERLQFYADKVGCLEVRENRLLFSKLKFPRLEKVLLSGVKNHLEHCVSFLQPMLHTIILSGIYVSSEYLRRITVSRIGGSRIFIDIKYLR